MIDPFPDDSRNFQSFFLYLPGIPMHLYIRDDVRKPEGSYSFKLNPQAPILATAYKDFSS